MTGEDDGPGRVGPEPEPQRPRPDRAGETGDAATVPPRRRHRRAYGGTAPARAQEEALDAVLPRSPDDQDTGWGERSDGGDDERLRREVPPHW